MAKLERTYTIPLRRDFAKVPKYKRSKRAIKHIKDFIVKHMKTEDVKLGKSLNEKVWMHGIKNPPGKVTVKAIKNEDVVTVELEGIDYKVEKVQTKKEEPKTLKDKIEAKLDKKEVKADKKEKPTEKKAKVKEEPKADEKPAEVKSTLLKETTKAKPEPVEAKLTTSKKD